MISDNQVKKSLNTIRSLITKLIRSKVNHDVTHKRHSDDAIVFDERYIRETFSCLLEILAHLPSLKGDSSKEGLSDDHSSLSVILDEIKRTVDLRLFETLQLVYAESSIQLPKDKSNRDLPEYLIQAIANGFEIAKQVFRNDEPSKKKFTIKPSNQTDLLIYFAKIDLIAREEIANFKTEKQKILHQIGRWMGRGYAIACGLTIFFSVFITGSWAWVFLALPLAMVNYHVNWENLAKSIVSKMTIDLFGGEHWYHFEGLRYYYCDDENDINYGKRIPLSAFKQSLMFVALALSVAAGFALAALGFSCITGITTLSLFHGVLIGGVWGKCVTMAAAVLATLLSATVFFTETALILFGMNKLLKNANPIKASINYFKTLLGSSAQRNANKSTAARILDSLIIFSTFTLGSALCVIALFFGMHVSIAPLASIFVAWGMGASSAVTLSSITCMWIAFSAQIPFALVTAGKFTKRFAVQFSDWLCTKIFTPKGYQPLGLTQNNSDTEINFNHWLQTKIHQEIYFGTSRWQKIKLRSQYYVETIINAIANVFVVIKNIFMTIVGLSGHANTGHLAMVGLLGSGTFVNSVFSCSLDIPDQEPDQDFIRHSYTTISHMKREYTNEDILQPLENSAHSGGAQIALSEYYQGLYNNSKIIYQSSDEPGSFLKNFRG